MNPKNIISILLNFTSVLVIFLTSNIINAATLTNPLAPKERLNDYPIVLVHGFFGWGRDEVFLYKHFGGFNDIQRELIRDHGFDKVVTPSMGPISSSWDRACELYAQLMGTRVDYGKAHSQKHNHERFGKNYTGSSNESRIDKLGEGQKVNLIAHSQGVQTARILIELLANGDESEKANTDDDDLSALFKGGNQWVNGLAALAAANDGSPLAHAIYNEVEPFDDLISMLVKAVNLLNIDSIYDFKLDHFGLDGRGLFETPSAYTKRLLTTMYDKKDSAFYDLSSDGSAEINLFATAEDDVYYYSWSNQTSELTSNGTEEPGPSTNPILILPTYFIGSYTHVESGHVSIGNAYWPNDGITSTRSMSGPLNWSTDKIVNYDKSIRDGNDISSGVWNYMGHLEGNWDHWDMLFILDGSHDVRPLYYNAANFLASTPGEEAGSVGLALVILIIGFAVMRRKRRA